MEIESFRILKEIDQLRSKLRTIDEEILNEKKRLDFLDKQKTKHQTIVNESEQNIKQLKSREIEIENELHTLDKQLKSLADHEHEMKHDKEIAALKQQRDQENQQKEQLENEGLKLLDQIEEISTQRSESLEFLNGLSQTRKEIEVEVISFEKTKNEESENIKSRIRALREQLPDNLLKAHMKLVKEKKPFTTTTLKNYACTQCGMSVSRQVESKLETQLSLVACPGCGRIILPLPVYS